MNPTQPRADLTGHLYTPARSAQRADAALSVKALLLFALALRIAAHWALPQPLVSDGLAYFTLAANMAAGQPPVDNMGLHAFYSIGYPLFLTPFFAAFGASAGVAFAANLVLATISALLVRGIARALALSTFGEQLALLGYAMWLPGIWNCTMLARENLSTPLLLAVALLALRLLDGRSKSGAARWMTAAMAGAIWGAAVLTGTSALPLIAAPLLALAVAHRHRLHTMAAPLLALALGAAMLLAPWAAATRAMVGAPVLTTNTGFNLYLGNNPAATGRYLSIAKTPEGPHWQAMRAQLGEAGAAKALGAEATGYMIAHPLRTAELGMRKLVLFWWPNLPDRADFTNSRAVALVRVGEVTQYLLLITLGLAALATGPVDGRRRAVIAVMVAGFWGLHGIAYIIERYRDPVMPLLIILTAGILAEFLQRRMKPLSSGEYEHAL